MTEMDNSELKRRLGQTEKSQQRRALSLERVNTIPLRKHKHHEERGQSAGLRSLFLALIYVFAVLSFVVHRHYRLPLPKSELLDTKGRPQFSETNARECIKYLAGDLGSRIVGTTEEHLARDFILGQINEYKELARTNPYIGEFSVDVQEGSGGHRFDFMDRVVWKRYVNVTNIIVKICGPECSGDVILLNSHYDSALPSTGAADDGIGVASMLEAIRIMSQSNIPRKNAIVFLFNGAEETLQDASHLFTTQHKYKDQIRAVINLEATGTTGKEILFQANSREMIKAYATVPHPHGSVLANDVFRTGIILGDTDFRMFVEYGDMKGLDMALYSNSYYYHTMLDTVEEIEQGSIQHMGDNIVALIDYLTSQASLSDIKYAADVVFYDVLGYFFVHYSWSSLLGLHAGIFVISALVTFFGEIAIHAPQGGRITFFQASTRFLLVTTSIAMSLVAAILVPNAVTRVLPTMVWYRHEWLALVLFVPWALSGILAVQYLFRRYTKTYKSSTRIRIDSDTDPEHSAFHGILFLVTIFLTVLTLLRIPTSYILFNYAASLICGLAVDWILRGRDDQFRRGHVHMAAYIIAWTPCAISMGDIGLVAMDMFTPLMGRVGFDAPVDNIIASLVGLLTFLMGIVFVPFGHRYGERGLRRLAMGCAMIGILAIIAVSRVYPYDARHPQRVFVQNQRNLTSGEIFLYVAHADRGPIFDPMIKNLENTYGAKAVLRTQGAYREDWRSLYPFSQFLATYRIDVTQYVDLGTKSISDVLQNVPTVTSFNSTYDAESRTRSISILYRYPGYIWPVVSFDAHVTNWSISKSKPFDHRTHYVLRESGGKGVDSGRVDLTFKVSSPDEKLFVELALLDIEGFGRDRLVEKKFGDKDVGILARARDATPGWVAAAYFGATVGVWEL